LSSVSNRVLVLVRVLKNAKLQKSNIDVMYIIQTLIHYLERLLLERSGKKRRVAFSTPWSCRAFSFISQQRDSAGAAGEPLHATCSRSSGPLDQSTLQPLRHICCYEYANWTSTQTRRRARKLGRERKLVDEYAYRWERAVHYFSLRIRSARTRTRQRNSIYSKNN